MKIAFFSNYLSHHQTPFCERMLELTNGNFRFIACEGFNEGRKSLGYRDMNLTEYVIRAYESEEQLKEAERWCTESDVIIYGSTWQRFVNLRRSTGLPTFRYSERFYKSGVDWHRLPYRTVKNFIKNSNKKNEYMLCASAFTPIDCVRTFEYIGKCYKWGYFPDAKHYDDIDTLINRKKNNSILWAGRLIDWKHPEKAIELAKRLKREGYSFSLDIVGNGDMEEELRSKIADEKLFDCVTLCGSMSPEKVREYMEGSEVFLFTSDRNEGWGAVLNESMNSACAVVASHSIGSVPFMVKDSENGFIYKNSDFDDLYKKVKLLLDNPERKREIAKEAYKAVVEQWNASNAAERFMKLAEAVLAGEKNPDVFSDGVCSKAKILKDEWYR